jgi:hypothetical protein
VDKTFSKNLLSPTKQLSDTNLKRLELRSAAGLLATPTYISKKFGQTIPTQWKLCKAQTMPSDPHIVSNSCNTHNTTTSNDLTN